MTFPRARLAVAASLFTAWLGYLFLLVVASRHTVVLSRPQFLITDLCVVADLTDANDGKPAGIVTIDRVFWSSQPADLKGARIEIVNLADAAAQGYAGPGKYILPLQPTKIGRAYEIAVVPPSPHYIPAFVDVELRSIGPDEDRDRAIRLATEVFGLSAADARARIGQVAHDQPPVTLARHVSTEQFLAFRERLPNANIRLVPNDVRIYPVTPETMEQLAEIVKTR